MTHNTSHLTPGVRAERNNRSRTDSRFNGGHVGHGGNLQPLAPRTFLERLLGQ